MSGKPTVAFITGLPFPVSSNRHTKTLKTLRRVKTPEYNKWINDAGKILNAQRPEKISGRVSLSIGVRRKLNKDGSVSKKTPDISNMIKGVEDLLVRHRIIDDDRLVESVFACWVDDGEGANVLVKAAE